jgi:outer membrane receptor protein involved in Fe transport
VKADYKTQPPRLDTGTNFTSGAAWDAFDLARQKPAVTAQATYYVPAAKGSHDLKVGFEYLLDIAKYAVDGRSGPIQYRDLNGSTAEIRFVDVGDNAALGDTWRGSNDRDQRYAGYAQDRWNPSNRVTITAGLRWDYQRPYYMAGKRDPLIKDVLTASSGSLAGQPMFLTQETPSQAVFTRNSIAPRLGVSYDVTGQGNTVVKGFYGRYYFNYADSFGNLNPGGANYKTFRFLDQNGNRRYDGPSELGALSSSSGGTSTTVNPDMKKPYADEYDLSVERQFWGESSVRVAYVRKNTANEFLTINLAREGQFTVPTPVTVDIRDFVNGVTARQTFTLLDIPAGLPTRNVIDNVPDGSYKYDTLQFAFNKRFGSGLFIQSSFDYQWRDELRGGAASTTGSTATLVAPSGSPLNSDPITVGYFQNVFPQVSNRQESTNWQGRAIARYVFKYDIGVATNLRVQSGYAFSRIIAATLPNAGAVRFYSEDIGNNRSDTVPILDFRIDKAFKIGKYKVTGMFDAFNLTNSAAVTNFNLTNGASYNQIIAALDPRTLQVGIRFDF